MARLYAATGDGIARLDEEGEAWAVELSLAGSGAQCLAIDPSDPDRVYPALRQRHRRGRGRGRLPPRRRRRPTMGGWPAGGAGGVLAGGERSRRGGVRGPRAEPLVPKRRPGRELARAGGAARAALAAALELPAAAVDLARALDRTQPARPGPAPRRDRTRRADALERRRRELAGPPARRAAGRALARLASACAGAGVRGRRRWRLLQHGRRRAVAAGGRGTRPRLHLVGDRRPRRSGLLVRLCEHRPLRRPRPRRPRGAHLPPTRRRTLAAARRRA